MTTWTAAGTLAKKPIPGVAFTVNGGRYPLKTDADGVAYLARLAPLQHTDIAIVGETLEDPHWLPRQAGLQLVPRPGTIATLDIPVLRTSEIDGTVYLAENERRRELGSVVIEIADPTGRVIATSTSGADGYYVLSGVPAGRLRSASSGGATAAAGDCRTPRSTRSASPAMAGW